MYDLIPLMAHQMSLSGPGRSFRVRPLPEGEQDDDHRDDFQVDQFGVSSFNQYGIPCKFESHISPPTEDTSDHPRKIRASSSSASVRAQSVPDFSPRPSNPLEPRLLGKY
jgi:hypothetical protein